MDESPNEQQIPHLRKDLSVREIEQDGERLVLLTDPLGIAPNGFAIPLQLYETIKIFDRGITFSEISDIVRQQTGQPADMSSLLGLVLYLDDIALLDSPRFRAARREIEEYVASPVRPPICAGNTYGATPESLAAQLDELMSHAPASDKNQARALIAPHIDFRVGDNALETYAAAYRAIEATDADLFVIFGTSHHKMSDWFMLSRKDYATPAGALETDQELIDEMAGALGDDLTIDEMAHRDEHSIELQAALIRHVFPNKEIKILPVLVGGFYPQIHQGNSPGNDPRFVEFIENLGGAIDKLGRRPLYIASGDFGHIGRKFEDDYDAESKLDELREADFEMIDLLNACDAEGFFARVQREGDPWKICGAAPFYALLRIAGPERGELLRYAQWNERETLSAVSFASIAYY